MSKAKFFSQNCAGGDYRRHATAKAAVLRAHKIGHFGESGAINSEDAIEIEEAEEAYMDGAYDA